MVSLQFRLFRSFSASLIYFLSFPRFWCVFWLFMWRFTHLLLRLQHFSQFVAEWRCSFCQWVLFLHTHTSRSLSSSRACGLWTTWKMAFRMNWSILLLAYVMPYVELCLISTFLFWCTHFLIPNIRSVLYYDWTCNDALSSSDFTRMNKWTRHEWTRRVGKKADSHTNFQSIRYEKLFTIIHLLNSPIECLSLNRSEAKRERRSEEDEEKEITTHNNNIPFISQTRLEFRASFHRPLFSSMRREKCIENCEREKESATWNKMSHTHRERPEKSIRANKSSKWR